MMLSAVLKEERSDAEEIVAQLLKANNQNPVQALYDAGVWLLEVNAQRLQAEDAVSAGFVRRKPGE
jgi:hypothetical protein